METTGTGKAVQIRHLALNSDEYRKAFQLRGDILKKPLGQTLRLEDLPNESRSFHLGAYENGKLVGALTWYGEGRRAFVKHLVVLSEARGTGTGKALLMQAEQDMKKEGYRVCFLKARVSAQGFYERTGYCSYGAMMPDAVPHIMMEKTLA